MRCQDGCIASMPFHPWQCQLLLTEDTLRPFWSEVSYRAAHYKAEPSAPTSAAQLIRIMMPTELWENLVQPRASKPSQQTACWSGLGRGGSSSSLPARCPLAWRASTASFLLTELLMKTCPTALKPCKG